MAEGIRFRLVEESISQLHNASTSHTTQITNLSNTLTTVVAAITSLEGRIDQLRLGNSSGIRSPGSGNTTTHPLDPFQVRPLRLDFPRFDGTDPLGWIFKATQFFEYHNTPDEQRLSIASFYMDSLALGWYQWMHKNHQFSSKNSFIQSLEIRFGPSEYVDHQGALSKLTQTSTVLDYQTVFETLANRTVGLPDSFMLSCFISGLRSELRREIQAFRPTTLSQAMGLAKLQEDKFSDAHGSMLFSRKSHLLE